MMHRSNAHETAPVGPDSPPAAWQQTPPSVQTLALTLLKRLDALEARLQQDSPTSYRPPSADSPYQKARQAAGFEVFVLTTKRRKSYDRTDG